MKNIALITNTSNSSMFQGGHESVMNSIRDSIRETRSKGGKINISTQMLATNGGFGQKEDVLVSSFIQNVESSDPIITNKRGDNVTSLAMLRQSVSNTVNSRVTNRDIFGSIQMVCTFDKVEDEKKYDEIFFYVGIGNASQAKRRNQVIPQIASDFTNLLSRNQAMSRMNAGTSYSLLSSKVNRLITDFGSTATATLQIVKGASIDSVDVKSHILGQYAGRGLSVKLSSEATKEVRDQVIYIMMMQWLNSDAEDFVNYVSQTISDEVRLNQI